MRIALLIVLILMLTSCSIKKRLANFVARHPEVVKSDTVFVSDTTIIDSIYADTSFITTVKRDTFYLEKEKLKVRVIRDTDTLWLDADVKADTVIKYRDKVVNTVNPVKVKGTPWYWWLIVVAMGILIVLLVVKRK